jgi:hypothetical protein
MLSEGQLAQGEIMEELGSPTAGERLADVLNSRLGVEDWRGQYFAEPEKAARLLLGDGRPWGALMNAEPLHMIVVDGLTVAGLVHVRDPWEGTAYDIEFAEFVGRLVGGVHRFAD